MAFDEKKLADDLIKALSKIDHKWLRPKNKELVYDFVGAEKNRDVNPKTGKLLVEEEREKKDKEPKDKEPEDKEIVRARDKKSRRI